MPINPSQPLNQTHVAPPPSPEVLVRTLASDARAISQGEISPMPEVITLHSTSGTVSIQPPQRRSKKLLFVVIAAVIGLLLIGYFVISSLTGGSAAPVVTP